MAAHQPLSAGYLAALEKLTSDDSCHETEDKRPSLRSFVTIRRKKRFPPVHCDGEALSVVNEVSEFSSRQDLLEKIKKLEKDLQRSCQRETELKNELSALVIQPEPLEIAKTFGETLDANPQIFGLEKTVISRPRFHGKFDKPNGPRISSANTRCAGRLSVIEEGTSEEITDVEPGMNTVIMVQSSSESFIDSSRSDVCIGDSPTEMNRLLAKNASLSALLDEHSKKNEELQLENDKLFLRLQKLEQTIALVKEKVPVEDSKSCSPFEFTALNADLDVKGESVESFDKVDLSAINKALKVQLDEKIVELERINNLAESSLVDVGCCRQQICADELECFEVQHRMDVEALSYLKMSSESASRDGEKLNLQLRLLTEEKELLQAKLKERGSQADTLKMTEMQNATDIDPRSTNGTDQQLHARSSDAPCASLWISDDEDLLATELECLQHHAENVAKENEELKALLNVSNSNFECLVCHVAKEASTESQMQNFSEESASVKKRQDNLLELREQLHQANKQLLQFVDQVATQETEIWRLTDALADQQHESPICRPAGETHQGGDFPESNQGGPAPSELTKEFETHQTGLKGLQRQPYENIEAYELLLSEKNNLELVVENLKTEKLFDQEMLRQLSIDVMDLRDLHEFEQLEKEVNAEQEQKTKLIMEKEAIKKEFEEKLSKSLGDLEASQQDVSRLNGLLNEMQRDMGTDGPSVVKRLDFLLRSLHDAEGVACDRNQQVSFLQTKNSQLEEKLKQMATLSKNVKTAESNLQREQSRNKSVERDLQRELQNAFNDITKLSNIVKGKVPQMHPSTRRFAGHTEYVEENQEDHSQLQQALDNKEMKLCLKNESKAQNLENDGDNLQTNGAQTHELCEQKSSETERLSLQVVKLQESKQVGIILLPLSPKVDRVSRLVEKLEQNKKNSGNMAANTPTAGLRDKTEGDLKNDVKGKVNEVDKIVTATNTQTQTLKEKLETRKYVLEAQLLAAQRNPEELSNKLEEAQSLLEEKDALSSSHAQCMGSEKRMQEELLQLQDKVEQSKVLESQLLAAQMHSGELSNKLEEAQSLLEEKDALSSSHAQCMRSEKRMQEELLQLKDQVEQSKVLESQLLAAQMHSGELSNKLEEVQSLLEEKDALSISLAKTVDNEKRMQEELVQLQGKAEQLKVLESQLLAAQMHSEELSNKIEERQSPLEEKDVLSSRRAESMDSDKRMQEELLQLQEKVEQMKVLEAQLLAAQMHSEELSNKLEEVQSLLEEKDALNSSLFESVDNEKRMQDELLQLQDQVEQSKNNLELVVENLKTEKLFDQEMLRQLSIDVMDLRDLHEFEQLEKEVNAEQEVNVAHAQKTKLIMEKEAIKKEFEEKLSKSLGDLEASQQDVSRLNGLLNEMQRDMGTDGPSVVKRLDFLLRSLHDAEGVACDRNQQVSFLQTKNSQLEEKLKQMATLSKNVKTAESNLQREQSRNKSVERDLQRELQNAFNDITKLSNIVKGKVPQMHPSTRRFAGHTEYVEENQEDHSQLQQALDNKEMKLCLKNESKAQNLENDGDNLQTNGAQTHELCEQKSSETERLSLQVVKLQESKQVGIILLPLSPKVDRVSRLVEKLEQNKKNSGNMAANTPTAGLRDKTEGDLKNDVKGKVNEVDKIVTATNTQTQTLKEKLETRKYVLEAQLLAAQRNPEELSNKLEEAQSLLEEKDALSSSHAQCMRSEKRMQEELLQLQDKVEQSKVLESQLLAAQMHSGELSNKLEEAQSLLEEKDALSSSHAQCMRSEKRMQEELLQLKDQVEQSKVLESQLLAAQMHSGELSNKLEEVQSLLEEKDALSISLAKTVDNEKRMQEELVQLQGKAEQLKVLESQLLAAQMHSEELSNKIEERQSPLEEKDVLSSRLAESMDSDKRMHEELLQLQEKVEQMKVLEAQLLAAQMHSEELSNKLEEVQSLLEEKDALNSSLFKSVDNEKRMQDELLQLQDQVEQSKVLEAQLLAAQMHSRELSNKVEEIHSLLEEKDALSSSLTKSVDNEKRMQEELLQLKDQVQKSKVLEAQLLASKMHSEKLSDKLVELQSLLEEKEALSSNLAESMDNGRRLQEELLQLHHQVIEAQLLDSQMHSEELSNKLEGTQILLEEKVSLSRSLAESKDSEKRIQEELLQLKDQVEQSKALEAQLLASQMQSEELSNKLREAQSLLEEKDTLSSSLAENMTDEKMIEKELLKLQGKFEQMKVLEAQLLASQMHSEELSNKLEEMQSPLEENDTLSGSLAESLDNDKRMQEELHQLQDKIEQSKVLEAQLLASQMHSEELSNKPEGTWSLLEEKDAISVSLAENMESEKRMQEELLQFQDQVEQSKVLEAKLLASQVHSEELSNKVEEVQSLLEMNLASGKAQLPKAQLPAPVLIDRATCQVESEE
uniref:putative leucine-rich repeat-containing protein DDB_G0290503 n=1 Tax=Myxine glutinosa TaxID=7769 RepID=UPI00358F6B8F